MLPNPQIGPGWLHEVLAHEEEDAQKLAVFLDTEEVPDSVYGQIRLNKLEVHVINTPEFQRLRYISQLAFAKAAFHTAEHSRFSHSLGACHVAKVLVDRLNVNLSATVRDPSERSLPYWAAIAERGKRQRTIAEKSALYRCGEIVTWTERVLIGLAGLLHDLPHCPYSHDIEGGVPSVVPKHDDYKRNPAFAIMLFDTERSTLAQVLAFYSDHFYRLMSQDPQWSDCPRLRIYEERERRKLMLADLLFECFVYEKPTDIGNGFAAVHTKEWPKQPIEDPLPTIPWLVAEKNAWDHRPQRTPVLDRYDWFQPYRHDLIGNTICADLVDYLARDAANAGVPLALDFKFLSRLSLNLYSSGDGAPTHLRIVFDLRDTKRGTVRYDVLHELFDYLRERFKIRERVTSHRVTHEGAAILKRAMTLLTFRPDGTPYEKPFVTLEQLHTDYRCNSDDSLLRHIATSNGEFAARLDRPVGVAHGDMPRLASRETSPPALTRRRAADLATRLLERRYHRPLALLTSHQTYFEVKDLASTFEPLDEAKNGTDVVVQNIWAIENHILEVLNHPNSGEIADAAIAYVLTPRGGLKEPQMLIAAPGLHRDVDVLPLGKATGRDESDNYVGLQLPQLHGVKEAQALSKADYLSLWRIFLFVVPELFVVDDDERPQRAAADFHRWIRGWSFVRRSDATISELPANVAKLLSDREDGLKNARTLANNVGAGIHLPEITTNGVNMAKITYKPTQRHRCRDIRHAFPIHQSPPPRPAVASQPTFAPEVDEGFFDTRDRLKMTEGDIEADYIEKQIASAISTAQASFNLLQYEECIAHVGHAVTLTCETPNAHSLQARARAVLGMALLRDGKSADALRELTLALKALQATEGRQEEYIANVSRDLLAAEEAAQIEGLIARAEGKGRSVDAGIEDLTTAANVGHGKPELLRYVAKALLGRGERYLRQRKYFEASTDFREASERFRQSGDRLHDLEARPHRNRAWWKHAMAGKRHVTSEIDELAATYAPPYLNEAIRLSEEPSTLPSRTGERKLKDWKTWFEKARRIIGPLPEDKEP
jgi:HD superfamily phosphohydrolase/tetratricopeptide (TPR) repeat protein